MTMASLIIDVTKIVGWSVIVETFDSQVQVPRSLVSRSDSKTGQSETPHQVVAVTSRLIAREPPQPHLG